MFHNDTICQRSGREGRPEGRFGRRHFIRNFTQDKGLKEL
jgi:hypothetical protein